MTDDDNSNGSDEPEDPFEEFVTLTPDDSSQDEPADDSPDQPDESGSDEADSSDAQESAASSPATPDESSSPADDSGVVTVSEASQNEPEDPDPGGSDGIFFDAPEDSHERMEWALLRIRFEGWKAASIHAVTDAAAVFLASNLLLTVFAPAWAPERIKIPSIVLGPAEAVVGLPESVFLPGTAFLTGGLGIVAFGIGLWLRVSQSLVEQFERANPSVAESLRTARDAAASGADSRMAMRLYEDVLARLRQTSSVKLIDERRVGAMVVLIIVMSVLTIQVSVHDITISSDSALDSSGPEGDVQVENFRGLQDGSDVLGDREDVSAGDENLTAQLDSTGGEERVEDRSQFPSDSGASIDGGGGSGTDSQQAGFTTLDQIEDAELIREYNIRIRENTEEN